MSYLFDSDAVSEWFKPRPLLRYLDWLRSLTGAERYTSAVVIGELYAGAYRKSGYRGRHFLNLQREVLPTMTVLPYDSSVAEVYGRIRGAVEQAGQTIESVDLQIAATALQYDLELVTGNLRHFSRVPGLRIHTALADARQDINKARADDVRA